MAEINEKVEHLKKLINYQEDVEVRKCKYCGFNLEEPNKYCLPHFRKIEDTHPFENDAERDVELEAIKKDKETL